MAGSQDDLAEKSLLSILGLTEVKSGRGGKYIPDGKISIGDLETFFELKLKKSLQVTNRDFAVRNILSSPTTFDLCKSKDT